MDYNDKLNDNQKKAVLTVDGPLLILAGAGSGKTRVITNRIAHLINNKNIQPYNIFAVTFTNKAAQEMKKRVIDLIGPIGKSVFIKTFHSASVFILRRFGDKIGIPQSFSIYDTSDQQTVIKSILVNMKLDPKKIKPSIIVSKISEIKDKAGLFPGKTLDNYIPDNFPFDFKDIYLKYNEKLKELNSLDFNDILIKCVELIRSEADVLEQLQRRWKYVMVDEYQDTNYAQYLITKKLAELNRNICVVGDDDQSIYSWRGADIKNILNFEKDYEDAQVITLEENYRSTKPILETASAIIKNNKKRKEKNLRSVKGDGEHPIWCHANNEYGEAEFVVNTIVSMKYKYNFTNIDFAIFYRTNAQSRVFEDQLRKENIPYRVIGGLKFYDRKEIKDILAYLKFISNTLDSVSMNRIINSPARGIGKTSIEKIKRKSYMKGISEWDVINNYFSTEKTSKGIIKFIDIINKGINLIHDVPEKLKLSNYINEVIEISGYRQNLLNDNSMESNTRLENIDEFLNSIIDYELANPEANIVQFLQDISLYTTEENPEDNPEANTNFITLMTVHNAKGLEFPVVFLTGMEENTFPHKFSIDSDEKLEEERRLCYVGITRAMEHIYLTSAEIRRTFFGVDNKEPSRFIYEIPENLIKIKNYNPGGFNVASYRRKKTFSSQKKIKLEEKKITSEHAKGDSLFNIKERVLHPKYGIGQIQRIDGSGDNLKLTITFGTIKKIFLEKYTPLEKIN